MLAFGGIVASLPPGQQARIAVAMRSSVLLPFLELHRTFGERAQLSARFNRLRAERDSLASQLVAARRLAQAGTQLRLMADLGALEELTFVPADLVPGRPRVGDSNVFMLRGVRLAEIRPPVGVFTGEGVVGVVRAADRRGALGEFWTHPDFRLSVETLVGGITGIVRAFRGDGGEADGFPKFTGGWTFSAPAAGDIDGDGRPEIASITREGYLFVWELAPHFGAHGLTAVTRP